MRIYAWLVVVAGCGQVLGLGDYTDGPPLGDGGSGAVGGGAVGGLGGDGAGATGPGPGGNGGGGGDVMVSAAPQWIRHYTGAGADVVDSITVTNTNAIYFCGTFDGELAPAGVVMPTTIISNGVDMFVGRIDADGEPQWLRSFGDDAQPQRCHDVIVLPGGAAQLTGSVTGSLTLDAAGTVGPFIYSRAYLMGINSSGVQNGFVSLGSDAGQSGNAMASIPGATILGGHFLGELDASSIKIFTSNTFTAGFAVRIFGPEPPWTVGLGATTAPTMAHKHVFAVGALADTAAVVAGDFGEMLSGPQNDVMARGLTDAFVAVLEPDNGNVRSLTGLGGDGAEVALALAVDASDRIVVAGAHTDSFDLAGRSIPPPDGRAGFVASFDGGLTARWVHALDGTDDQLALDVAVDTEENVWVVGSNAGTLDLGDGAVTGSSAFVAGYTPSGQLRFATHFVSDQQARGRVVATAVDGDPIVGIHFRGNLDVFGTMISSASDMTEDFVIVRLDIE